MDYGMDFDMSKEIQLNFSDLDHIKLVIYTRGERKERHVVISDVSETNVLHTNIKETTEHKLTAPGAKGRRSHAVLQRGHRWLALEASGGSHICTDHTACITVPVLEMSTVMLNSASHSCRGS